MRRWPGVFLVVIAMVAGGVVVASPAAAAPAWKIVSSPNPPSPPTGSLSGVACAAPTSCFAVGSRDNLTLIERWGGQAFPWTVVPSPNAMGSNQLSAVACSPAGTCFAVGSSTDNGVTKTLIERWDGAVWNIVPSPNPNATSSSLSGISCTGDANHDDCVAVGTANGALILRLTINTWDVMSTPAFPGGLNAVSCSSATNCLAVGTYQFDSGTFEGSAEQSFSARWNGSVWAQESVDEPPSDPLGTLQNFRLTGVSCKTATHCFAVGEYDLPGVEDSYRTLTEQWNGVQWSTVASPNAADLANSALSGVSCTGSTSCTAVGRRFNSSETSHTLIESWNGSSWSVVTSPNAAAQSSVLSDVACASATGCMAVGVALPVASRSKTLIERWSGATWSVLYSPNGAGSILATLNGVACTSATNCFAVGLGPVSAPIERWNGTAWSVVVVPLPAGRSSATLNAVSCPTATSCFAVGQSYASFDGTNPLIERWNGTSWSAMTAPSPAGDSVLRSISCASATSCFAVGDTDENKTLIERWNGSVWTIVASPNPSVDANSLTGVSCTSPTSCLAVGSYYSFPSGTRTLSQRWNGTSWTVVPSPNRAGAQTSTLEGIACTSAANCYAVGAGTVSGVTSSFIVRWNGTTWAGVASGHPGDASSTTLAGVSCSSATSCSAVGSYVSNVNGATKTFVDTWNGTSWAYTTSPNRVARTSSLEAVSCVAGPVCMAVGSAFDGAQTTTLTERYA
jgi:hypothetical protein